MKKQNFIKYFSSIDVSYMDEFEACANGVTRQVYLTAICAKPVNSSDRIFAVGIAILSPQDKQNHDIGYTIAQGRATDAAYSMLTKGINSIPDYSMAMVFPTILIEKEQAKEELDELLEESVGQFADATKNYVIANIDKFVKRSTLKR